MSAFKEMTQVAALLGEENEQRLKDAVTDVLIRAAEKNIEEWMRECYVLDFSEMFDEIQAEVRAEVKKRIMKRVKAELEKENNNAAPR